MKYSYWAESWIMSKVLFEMSLREKYDYMHSWEPIITLEEIR